jgi:hypothetical protein
MSEKLKFFCLAMVLAALSGALFFFFPYSDRNGAWAHCVLNNWEQYGFSALRGQLVTNPGGHGALDDPQIYGGHRPHVARAAYFIGILTGSPGEDGWLFHVLLSVIVGISIWIGFGRTNSAALLAICTIISPGFIRSPLQLDTLAIPVLLGIPVLFVASRVFPATPENWRKVALFFVLLVFYTQINWTTALSVFVIFSYLVASKKLGLKSLALFLATSGAAIGFVLIISLLHKKSGTGSAPESAAVFFNSYLFGRGGYGGLTMDWVTAIRRIAVANIIGLVPLLVGLLLIAAKSGATKLWKPCHFLPLAASGLCIAVLRNYFAAHPWMAASIIILGLLATMKLLSDISATRTPAASSGLSLLYCASLAILSLIYSWGIINVLKLNSLASDSIAEMVRTQTQRGDLIVLNSVVFRNQAAAERIGDLCDRLILAKHPAASISGSFDSHHFILTDASQHKGYDEVSNTSAFKDQASPHLSMLLDAYRKKVSQRTAGDGPLPIQTYYLLAPEAEK